MLNKDTILHFSGFLHIAIKINSPPLPAAVPDQQHRHDYIHDIPELPAESDFFNDVERTAFLPMTSFR
jgi:hypothetical protein